MPAENPNELIAHRPSRGLRPHVGTAWGFRETGAAVERRELPSASFVLVVSFGPTVANVDERGAESEYGSFLAGLQRRPVTTRHGGLQHGIQVDLTPRGAFAISGVPLHELTDRCVPLSELPGPIRHLEDRLKGCRGWSQRFAALEALLGDAADGGPGQRSQVRHAIQELYNDPSLSIESLARDIGWSRRHLRDQFWEQVGVAPKTLGRIFRFRRVLDGIHDSKRSLAEVAQQCGYHDQAHLTREFSQLAGMAPGRFRAAAAD